MKNYVAIILSFCISNFVLAQITTTQQILCSSQVNDSFEIYISTPKNYNAANTYNVVYYCDANLKSGKLLRETINQKEVSTKIQNTIFVGVGHIGNYHVLRRRDFILPSINNNDTIPQSKNYGQTENFYQFLKLELKPLIQSSYHVKNSSIFGHSLGGLFTFYCLFKNENLFTNYYALSPALWIDKYNIYEFNKLQKSLNSTSTLYLSAGGLETMNHIKKGADDMNEFLTFKKYNNLNFVYEVHSGKTHNSQVAVSITYLLNHL
ncbi:MAG: alpha/beta hydrolase [Ferruginibacter sp.]|nr:alpha/beta hydrolase [Ferruginibacter sp.]